MASTEQQIDDAVAKRHIQNTDTALGVQSAHLDMNLHKIIGLEDPTGDRDVAHKKYVDDHIGGGAGDVVGPDSATNSAVSLFNGITGKLIKDSTRLIEDVMSDGSDIPDGHAVKTYGDLHWSEGSGDVHGPTTHAASYVPQWNETPNSKTLLEGFIITVAGKALLDDTDVAAQRTTLELLSAALRDAEDTLTDDNKLPDGHAIKVYGDANWGGSGSGDVVGPASATDNAIPLYDGITGKLIQNSLITVDAAGAPTLPNDTAIRWKDAGGTSRNVLAYDSVDNIIIGVDGDDAKVYIERLDTSSAGAPLQDSRRFSIVANYWKTAAEHQRMATIYHDMQSDTPKSTMHFDMGEDGAEIEMFALENDNGVRVAIIKNLIKIEGGSPGVDKVLMSDVNGLASWGVPSGSSKWTDGGTVIYGIAEGGNSRLHDSGLWEIGALGGTSAPLITTNKWGFSSSVTEGARRLLVLDGTEDETSTPSVWIEKFYQSNGIPAGDPTIPVCLYVAHKHTGSGDGFTHSIMAYALNEGTGNNDVIAVSGRARKKGAGEGDSCGVWGSAYNDVNQNGGIMGVEAAIYQNAAGMVAGDRLMDKWSVGLHVSGISLGSPAKAGIAIDAANTHRFWNGIIVDKNCFVSGGPTGTVGINMGSHDSGNHPQYAIKFGVAGTHLYCNSGDLKFYDPVTGAKTLAELAAGGGGSSKWTDAGTYIYPNNTGNSFRVYDDERLYHSLNGANPFNVPAQIDPQKMGFGTAGIYSENGGTLWQFASWGSNSGSSGVIGVHGSAFADGTESAGWGGNFVAYARHSGGGVVACELNYGALVAGCTELYGLVVNPCGWHETRCMIQMQSANADCRCTHAILFNEYGGGVVQPGGSLIKTQGNVAAGYGIDFTDATFTGAVIQLGSATVPHLSCNGGDLRFYDPITGSKTLAQLCAGGGIGSVEEDPAPKLGADLDLNAHMIKGYGIVGLENTYGYYCKNTGGSYRKAMCLNNSNDWEIALDANYVVIGYGCSQPNPIMIHVNGWDNKQIGRSPDTDSQGKHYLVIIN